MKTLGKRLTSTALGLALAGTAFADHYDGGQPYGYFDQRSQSQHDRINLGLQRGLLTPDEARSLYEDQRRLDRMERQFRSDGYLSSEERGELERAYNDAGYWIFRLKHNPYRELPDWYRRYGEYDDYPYRGDRYGYGGGYGGGYAYDGYGDARHRYNDGLDEVLWWR